jgi:hypothetical protein
MGARSDGVCKVTRGRKPRWVIDFRFRDRDGREQRCRRDAHTQTAAGARAEAARLMDRAATTGSLELRPEAPLFCTFVATKFRPLYMPTHCRPATIE